MKTTRSQTWQWLAIIVALLLLGAGYWYFSARAGVKQGAPLAGPAPSNLVGYWSFDGDDISGTTAYDRSGQGNNGTLTNDPTKTNGKLGQALSFDATDDFVAITSGPSIANASFTISAWAKRGSTGAHHFILGQGTNTNNQGLHFGFRDTNVFTFAFWLNDLDTIAVYTDLDWHQWTATYDASTNARKIYRDGVIVASDTASADYGGSGALDIGDREVDANGRFSGSVDEVRIYNTVLTASQVYDLYKLGGETVGASTPTRDSLNEGLAGYWKLDDASGTTATDSSTNGNNGTLTNGPTWAVGQIGGAVDFDGADDRVVMGDVLDVTDGADFTLSGWVYRDASGAQWDSLITKRSSVDIPGYYVDISSDKLRLGVRDTANDSYSLTGTTTLGISTWYHFAAVFDDSSSTITELYINGKSENSTKSGTLGNINDLSNTYSLTLGRNADGTGYLNGKLDEARIYNRALSADEVTRLFKTTTPSNPDTRLKGYWSFDGDSISGTTARDLSGAGNNGTLTNGPIGTYGAHGQALSFDGSNDYTNVLHTASLNMSSNWSVGAWVNASGWYTGTCRANSILEKGDDQNNGWYGLRIGDSGGCGVATGIEIPSFFVRFSDGTQGSVLGNSVLQLNTWYYLSGTFDGTYLRIYVNGVLDTTSVSYGGKSVSSNSNALTMGKLAHGGFEYWFNGKIDEVRIYNAALSASEIYNLYQEGSVKVNKSQSNNGDSLNDGLSGYWKLDDASGTTATDSSVNSGNGTLTNGPTWGTGQIGGATTFDGTNDYITVPDAAILRPGNGDFTVSVWANPPNTNQLAFLVSKTAGNPGYSMRICGADPSCGGYSGKRFVFTYAESMVAPIYRGAYSTADIADGSWHLFTAVADKTANLIRLYVDGKEIAANQGTGGSWPNITNTEALILGSFTGSNYYHTGSLDEVRIYSRILSGEEISRLYKTTSPTNPESGLVGYWSFNGKDMAGTTAYDRSGKGNNGTLTNGPTTDPGKIGQALSFDGVDDYIRTGNTTAFDSLFSGGITLCSWVKYTNLLDYNRTITINDNTNTVYDVWLQSGITDGKIEFGSGGAGKWKRSTMGLAAGSWYHVCGETDYSDAGTKIFINGVDDGGTVNVTPTYVANKGSLDIGVLEWVGKHYGVGVYDEVRIYNRALSSSEIQSLYNYGR